MSMQPLIVKILLVVGIVFAAFDVVLIFACVKVSSLSDKKIEDEMNRRKAKENLQPTPLSDRGE